MLNDIIREHLEIEEEMLLVAQNVKISFGTVQGVEEVRINLRVCYFDSEDLFTCLLGMHR